MINTKEDFKGKILIIPRNISEKKFNKIKNKFFRLGFGDYNGAYAQFKTFQRNTSYNSICLAGDNRHINFANSLLVKKLSKISIKEFLKDKSDGYTIELSLNPIRLMVTTIDNDIKVKYNCYEKKEKFKKGDKITISIDKRTGDRSWTNEVLIYIGEYQDSYIVKRTKGIFIENPIYLRKDDYDLSDATDLIKLLKENFKYDK